MKRTQIYLDEETFHFLEHQSRSEKKTISEVIRDSIAFYSSYRSDEILKNAGNAFGTWKDHPASVEKYIRVMRKERKRW